MVNEGYEVETMTGVKHFDDLDAAINKMIGYLEHECYIRMRDKNPRYKNQAQKTPFDEWKQQDPHFHVVITIDRQKQDYTTRPEATALIKSRVETAKDISMQNMSICTIGGYTGESHGEITHIKTTNQSKTDDKERYDSLMPLLKSMGVNARSGDGTVMKSDGTVTRKGKVIRSRDIPTENPQESPATTSIQDNPDFLEI